MTAYVDCERHVLVERLEDLLEHVDETWRYRMTAGEFALPSGTPHPGVELEGHPVDPLAPLPAEAVAAILVPAQAMATSGWLGHELGATFAAALNDYVMARALPTDERLRAAAAICPLDATAAAAEIRRVGPRDDVVAVCTPPIAINLGNAHFHPIYEALAEVDLPLLVHPGGFEGSVVGPARLGGIGPHTPEETFTLMPQVAMANLASLVFDGVFEAFPTLRVVFAGFGFDWLPPVLWRADAEWRGLRGEVPWLQRAPSEYVARHVRFVVDGACELAEPGSWKLAEMLPDGVLLYGSDAPFADAPASEALAGAGEQLRERIALGNALETFALGSDPSPGGDA